MKQKTKTKKIITSLLLGLFFSFFCFQTVSAEFNYKLLETFPGFFAAGDSAPSLPEMILAIYKFGIWTVGIAGLFMLVVGGFMYMASAGNTSTAGSARKIISDALLGIVAALGAYLIMYVINPDLTKIDFTNFVAVDVTEQNDFGGGSAVPDPVTPSTTSSGGCMKVVRAAEAAKAAGWVYSPQPNSLRGKTVNSVRYTDCSDLVYSSYKTAGCSLSVDGTANMYPIAQAFNNVNELKAGDAVVRKGHVIMCMIDGCSKIIHAPGKAFPITIKSGNYFTGKTGVWADARVIKASKYCSSC